jgi:hypothetical protein
MATTGGSLQKGLRAVVFLGMMLGGLFLIAIIVKVGTSSAPASTPAKIVAPIGSTVTMRDTVLWVDPLGVVASIRAYNNHDRAAQERAFDTFGALVVSAGTPAIVTARDGELTQLALLDGPNAGRRGWTNATITP